MCSHDPPAPLKPHQKTPNVNFRSCLIPKKDSLNITKNVQSQPLGYNIFAIKQQPIGGQGWCSGVIHLWDLKCTVYYHKSAKNI